MLHTLRLRLHAFNPPSTRLALTLGAILAMLVAQFASAAIVAAQSGTDPVLIEENAAQAGFNAETRELVFRLRAVSDERIKSVLLLYYVDGSPVQNTATPNFQPGMSVTASYLWRVAGVLLPGSEVKYQWQIETDSGRKQTTAPQTVAFTDTRFQWRETQGDQVTVFSHSGDTQTGQTLLDEVRKTQTKLRSDFGLTQDKPLRVYAYSRAQDYTSALGAGGRQLEGAVTVGADRIFVLAATGPTGLASAAQAVRREVAVAILAQKTDNPYGPPPRWLSEGFSLYLGEDAISEQNFKALQQLANGNQLLPLRSLGGNFPTADRERSLAYIESLSAVKFMYETYGPEKVKGVLASFKEGSTADDALKKGLGVTLEQFETRWKNALKNGSAARATARTGGQQANVPEGNSGWVGRVVGESTLTYWRGVFGPNTPWVLAGVSAAIVIGFVAVIGGTILSSVRSARREVEE